MIGASSLVGGCDRSSAADVRPATRPDSAEQVMFGVRAALTTAGVKRGELSADSGLSFDAGTRYDLYGVRATFTTSLDRPLSTMSAREATYLLAEATLDVAGQVAIVSDTSRRRLESPHVRWTASRNELSSDSAFVATAGTRRLTGTGFVSDPGLFTLRCLRDCKGSLGR